MVQTKQAFTLIELLVVVLIIGILAAVAVPQYQKAVVRSRVSAILPILQSLTKAEEVYYLTNGSYTLDAGELDISVPAECSDLYVSSKWEAGKYWTCGNDFIIDLAGNETTASYCSGKNSNWFECAASRDFTLAFDWAHGAYAQASDNLRRCKVENGSALGQFVCNTLFK
ncbi:MAG: prepilin-type N-terminal cleavage/methylation domain-containing protein [Elusimicrobiaceae bacterium]|nr:prepilin-type N-terminal cleavage/methylation domain-containing protein [Elusimicrobiaceae bacterium]